ncbi:Son of sevenless-like protein [Smittium mucronatum]|uniref:Son of sevenless-like protein n=1 Tax=Smittium mucronatum TaxID=133383 RepID=A0A1R0GVC4_9FUNG|nr:Son of sevenless-like protein [Smittium mucronatum]
MDYNDRRSRKSSEIESEIGSLSSIDSPIQFIKDNRYDFSASYLLDTLGVASNLSYANINRSIRSVLNSDSIRSNYRNIALGSEIFNSAQDFGTYGKIQSELPIYWEERKTLTKDSYFCNIISDQTTFDISAENPTFTLTDSISKLAIDAKNNIQNKTDNPGKEFLNATIIASKVREANPNRFRANVFPSTKKGNVQSRRTINDVIESFLKYPEQNHQITYDLLFASIAQPVGMLDSSILAGSKVNYIIYSELIISSINQIFSLISDPKEGTGSSIRVQKRQIVSYGCDLLLSSAIAAGTWPPPDSDKRVKSNAIVLLSKVTKFISEARKLGLQITQLNLDNVNRIKVLNKISPSSDDVYGQDRQFFNGKNSTISSRFISKKLNGIDPNYNLNSGETSKDIKSQEIQPTPKTSLNFKGESSSLKFPNNDSEKISLNRNSSDSILKIPQKRSYEDVFLKLREYLYRDNGKKNIPILILKSLNDIEKESIKLANILQYFCDSIVYASNIQRNKPSNNLNPQALKESNPDSSIMDSSIMMHQFDFQLSDICLKCQDFSSSVGTFVSEINKIERLVSLCGIDENLISLSDVLNEEGSASNIYKKTLSTLFFPKDNTHPFNKKSPVTKLKRERDQLISNCVKVVACVQDLSFMSPLFTYYHESINKNPKARTIPIQPKYTHSTIDINSYNSVVYTNLGVLPDRPDTFSADSNATKKADSIANNDVEKDYTHDELYGIRDTDLSFKNLVHIIRKPSSDEPVDIEVLIDAQMALNNNFQKDLVSLGNLMSDIDKLCLNLWMSSKTALDSCSRRILDSLYMYLTHDRLLPSASSNKPKKSVNSGNYNSDVNQEKNFQNTKSIPIIPKPQVSEDSLPSQENKEVKSKSSSFSSNEKKKKRNIFTTSFDKSFLGLGRSQSMSDSKKQMKAENDKNLSPKKQKKFSLFPRSNTSNNMYNSADKNFSRSSLISKVMSSFSAQSQESFNEGSKKSETKSNPINNNQSSYAISSQNDQPYYLQYDYPEGELILDSKGTVKAGTLLAMTERLTAHDVLDTQFVNAFMLTYHAFTTTPRLFGFLFKRYAIEEPEGMDLKEEEEWRRKKLNPIRIRVFNILKRWLREHFYYNIEGDLDALEMLRLFASTIMEKTSPGLAKQLLKMIENYSNLLKKSDNYIKKIQTDGSKVNRNSNISSGPIRKNSLTAEEDSEIVYHEGNKLAKKIGYMSQNYGYMSVLNRAEDFKSNPPPNPIIFLGELSNVNSFLQINTLELARQICIIDFSLLSKVRPAEFLQKAWNTSPSSPGAVNGLTIDIAFNLRSISAFSTRLSNFIVSVILKQNQLSNRVRFIEYFIDLGQNLYSLKNFNGLMNVIGGLQSTPVLRLEQTWSQVSSNSAIIFEKLKDVMKNVRNYSNYREILKMATPPSIPYVGLMLTDLTFIEDGNPEYYNNEEGVINFSKYKQVSDIIMQIQLFQCTPYSLIQVNEIMEFFFKCLKFEVPYAPSEDNLYNIFYKASESIEPSNV